MKKKLCKKILILISICILIKFIVVFGTALKVNDIELFRNHKLIQMNKSVSEIIKYNWNDFVGTLVSEDVVIQINTDDNVIFDEKIKIDILAVDKEKSYNLIVENNGESKVLTDEEKKYSFEYPLVEGENDLNIQVYEGNNCIAEKKKKVYFVRRYEKQFLDELSSKGTIVHYLNGTWERYEDTADLLIAAGIKNIRTTFSWDDIEYENEKYNFEYYDKWIQKMTDNNVNILASYNRTKKYTENSVIGNEVEKNHFLKLTNIIEKRYPQIKNYQFINEPNINGYSSEDAIYWYANVIETLSKNVNEKYIVGGLAMPIESNNNTNMSVNEFCKYLFKYANDIYNVGFHTYDSYSYTNNNNFCIKNNDINEILERYGGFIQKYITEYGIHSTNNYITVDDQAKRLVQQTVLTDYYNAKMAFQYNFWNVGTDSSNSEHNYGLITNDYTPKKSYYSMKNYYQNTNGAEYIGSIPSVADGLEFHVYDKDGVPLIICWSSDNSKTIEIPYSSFTAYDFYGNEIENTDGKLSITSSPVYLKNADRSYFYRAISNTAVNAYDEFLTNYSDYLDSSDEMISIKNKVNQMKKYAAGLATNGEVTEAEALSKMKEHFAIGDMIIDAYKNGKLSCEYVKLSSMLDQLNTIAYAFEDLLTITAKDVSNAKLEATESIMNSFDNVVSANSEVEMVYPNKIKAFAKDYYDTSSYINGLEEENPIKNGLIVSKGLHAYYLAEWASSFADCYLQDYEVKIKYSTTDLTNEDVVATLETDAPIELEGSNQYTFTENGSFTFKYTLNGEEKEITAVVDWIDKDAPVISGIDEREDDMDQVTLNVTDANLDSISLKKDGQEVSFNNGDVLIEVGEYVVIATDLAGNKSERTFKIVDYIESNKTYYISLNGTGDGLSDENPMNVKDVNKTRFYSGDKILFKSGEKYSIDIDCIRKGSPDNRVVISNYGDGELPIINGSISLMSNGDISNLKFTNGAESCLVTNYDFCENVKVENCIFDEVHDTAIYLNRQVSNIEITNCIFKNCKSTAIVMKNDSTGFEADKVSVNNNVFIDIAKSIEIGSESLDNAFLEIEISKNYFVGQTGSDAIININKIVPDKFEVYIYSNLFYGFDNSYKVIAEDENIKKFLVCDYNAFYRYSESNIFNDIKNIADLINRYDNENGSKVVFISKEKYEVEKCLESVSTLNSVDEIVEFLSKDVKEHEGEKQLRSYGRTDELIINKVLTADEMKTSNMKVMTDSTVADEKLPLAGWQKVSIAVISIIVVTGMFSAIKYAKFKKDTRKQIRRK